MGERELEMLDHSKHEIQVQHSPSPKVAPFELGVQTLTPNILYQLSLHPNPRLIISQSTWTRLQEYRGIVDQHLHDQSGAIYGINTGFGFLSDVRIAEDQLEALQVNLIRSHACGVGNKLAPEVVRAILILRAHTFLIGHSGVSRECVEAILQFLYHDILPVIPEKGSVGASGDLCPLAHLALALLGEGQVLFQDTIMPAKQALARSGLKPYQPKAKEGLSLINGTHFMTALSALIYQRSVHLLEAANMAASLSIDAFRASLSPFAEDIHRIRPQKGQAEVAKKIREMMSGNDEIMASHASCGKVQDPYCFRCIPQVHGACLDTLNHVQGIIERELNAVTDNPLVFTDGKIISGGNFHGEPIAFAMDFLAIAAAELGGISERRIEKLTNPQSSGLPAFLVANSGLNSGFMIPHVVAAALVSENKILAHPASVDSIPTSAAQEDHVSMGSIAALKAWQVVENVGSVLAIEMLSATQGIDLLAPLKPSAYLQKVYKKVRSLSPTLSEDRSIHSDIEGIAKWILQGASCD